MPKRLLLLCVLLAGLWTLSACRQLPGGPTNPAPTKAPDTVADTPLTYLYFSESASYYKRVQAVEYRMEDGRHTAYFYMANEDEPYPVPVDQAWADTLNGFVVRYDMLGWDGFSGTAPGLLDGTHFSVELTLADGTQVRAGGYGDFPEGYGDASAAIDAHFLQLLPEDMRDW